MAYSEGRIVHDADAHIMETPTWLADHADPAIRARIKPLRYPGVNELRQTGDPEEQQRDLQAAFDKLQARHASADYRRDEAAQVMTRKNFAATDRSPELRIGVIEQGAIWIPSWTRQMESAFEAFARHEDRLRALSLRPTEYVQRQVRATPYPTDDVGWIIEQSGPDICMFSSDYPHVEGGRKPLERFEASLGEAPDAVRDKFYKENFLDLMGGTAVRLAA